MGYRIIIGQDWITIYDLDAYDMQRVEMKALETGCTTQMLEDDGTYCTVEVSGTENKLYDFLRCAIIGLNGIIN